MAARVCPMYVRIVAALAPLPDGFRYKSSLPTEMPTTRLLSVGYCFTAAASALSSFVTVVCPAEHQIPRSRVVPVSMAAWNAVDGVSVVPYSIMVYKRALLKPEVPVSFCAAANSVAKSVPALLVEAP